MNVARPDGNSDLIWKYPSATLPARARCDVAVVDWAVIALEGRPLGTLDSGQFTLTPEQIPFLDAVLEGTGRSAVLRAEMFYVKRTPFPLRYRGKLGTFEDPMSGFAVDVQCDAEVTVRVENPERLVYNYFGMRKFQTEPDLLAWLATPVRQILASSVQRMAREQRRALATVLSAPDLRDVLLANAADLGEMGLRIVGVPTLQLELGEADRARLRAVEDQRAQARLALEAEEQEIQRAALEAQKSAAAGTASAGARARVTCPHCQHELELALQVVRT